MPLPHFLLLLVAVIVFAGLTIAVGVGLNAPLASLGIIALLAAAGLHYLARHAHDEKH